MRERAPLKHIFSGLKILVTSAYIYNQCSSLLLIMVRRYKRKYTDTTLTLRKSMNMRASFNILLVLHYFRCFVSTNGMIVGLHVPNNLQMYRLNSEKHGGGGGLPPPIMLLFVLFYVCTIIMILSVGIFGDLAPIPQSWLLYCWLPPNIPT